MSIRFKEAESIASKVVPVLSYPANTKTDTVKGCKLKPMVCCSVEFPLESWNVIKFTFEYNQLVQEISKCLNGLSRCCETDASIWSFEETNNGIKVILDTTAISIGLFDFVELVRGLVIPIIESIKVTGVVFSDEYFDKRSVSISCSNFQLNENGHVVAM